MLSVTSQSVRYYVKHGILDGKITRAKCLVLLSSIEDFTKLDIKPIEDKRNIVERLKSELDEQQETLCRAMDKLSRDTRSFMEQCGEEDVMINLCKRGYAVAEIIYVCAKLMEDDTGCHKQAEVIRAFMSGDTFGDIGARLNLSKERARQLFYRGCRSMANLPKYIELVEENRKLREQVGILTSSKQFLCREIEDIKEKMNVNTDEDMCLGQISDMLHDSFLNSPINELYLSARPLNVLKRVNVERVIDLLHYDEKELMRMRDMGRKSVTEIEDSLESVDLKLDMTNREIYQWMKQEQVLKKSEV